MEAGQIIDFNNNALIGLKIVSTVITVGLTILMIYLCILGIKALKIYKEE